MNPNYRPDPWRYQPDDLHTWDMLHSRPRVKAESDEERYRRQVRELPETPHPFDPYTPKAA